MSLASDINKLIKERLSLYEDAEGKGPDFYFDRSSYHPMGDGKYLQAICELHRTKQLSSQNFNAKVSQVLPRLSSTVITVPGNAGVCWGLGWSWRELPEDEPFLITSAIVTKGLISASKINNQNNELSSLTERGVVGLNDWFLSLNVQVDDQIHLPVYSPSITEPIFNTAACALSVLKLANDEGYETVDLKVINDCLNWIYAKRIDGLGWTYSKHNMTVDLLHQCYILNSCADVLGCGVIERETVELLGQFSFSDNYLDAVRVLEHSRVAFQEDALTIYRKIPGWEIEILNKPARLWSLGELLSVISRLVIDGRHSKFWQQLGRALSIRLISVFEACNEETKFPRHSMHAIHGLSCFLGSIKLS